MSSSATLLGPHGGPAYVPPTPNERIEEKVREELKNIDGLLDIQWFPTAVYNETHDTFEGRYGLIVEWPSQDPRWKLYREGEIGEPFDLLGWFCEDERDADSVPLDRGAIRHKAIELLAACDNAKESWKRRMARVLEHNERQREKNRKRFLDRHVHEAAQGVWRDRHQFSTPDSEVEADG